MLDVPRIANLCVVLAAEENTEVRTTASCVQSGPSLLVLLLVCTGRFLHLARHAHLAWQAYQVMQTTTAIY